MGDSSSQTPEGTLLWKPSHEQIRQANLTRFREWLARERDLEFRDYHELWHWSAYRIEAFWEAIWDYFQIPAHHPWDAVLTHRRMPGARWFPGARLNFVDQVFRHRDADHPALLARTEEGASRKDGAAFRAVSWNELYRQSAAVARSLRALGVEKGDRVAAYVTNGPEAVVGFLATASIGAIWSSCSPDFGPDSVVDRFGQIRPRVLLAVDGYRYGGKRLDRMDHVARLQSEIPGLEATILIPSLEAEPKPDRLPRPSATHLWEELARGDNVDLKVEPVEFDHPLWILYSSGTTGLPKPIVHGHGGMLLEHLKYLDLHADLRRGDRFFWFTTTGWMMWNVVVASLLRGATAVLYDGSPGYPELDTLWRLAHEARLTCLGTSATYLVHCMREGLNPGATFDLSPLRSVGSTGSPLPPEAYRWVYERVRGDIMLNSTSGGTDICSSFVGGNPVLPVHAGEIQCRTLGAHVQAFSPEGETLTDEVGEMVVTEPMPCMPLRFWGDEDGSRYRESYFEMYPGVWRHGDWLKVTPRGSCVIYGRSDATLNRQGVRIGTSEIYRALQGEERVLDSLVVSLEREDGSWYMPLFVRLAEGDEVDEALVDSIQRLIRRQLSPRFVPDDVVAVREIPRTLSGKKLEAPVKRILEGTKPEEVASPDSMENPESLDVFRRFAVRRRGA